MCSADERAAVVIQIKKARYGESNPRCSADQFYDTSFGSSPVCKDCVGFKYSQDSDIGCDRPVRNEDAKAFCGELAVQNLVSRGSTEICQFEHRQHLYL